MADNSVGLYVGLLGKQQVPAVACPDLRISRQAVATSLSLHSRVLIYPSIQFRRVLSRREAPMRLHGNDQVQ